jgi:hypothetical protein
MDPYVEKDMIDCLKSISLSLTEVNVRLEGIERAIKEANYMNDSDELEYADEEDNDEGVEEKELEKSKKEELDEDSSEDEYIDNPQAKFNVDDDETQTLEEFGDG